MGPAFAGMIMMIALAGTETFRLPLEAGPWRNTRAATESHPAGGDAVLRGLSKFDGDILERPLPGPDETSQSPTGGNAEGVNTIFESILPGASDTKAADPDCVGLNAAWTHDGRSWREEWDDPDFLRLELSRRIDADAVPLGDPVLEREWFEDMDLHLIELGPRRQGGPLSVVSVSTGPGAAEDTPDVRLIFAFERSF